MFDHVEAEERVALTYAPKALRPAYRGLFLLDAQLRHIALSAREPALAQLKLAWWRDACSALSASQGHPVLRELARSWLGENAALRDLVDAWEELAAGDGDFLAGVDAIAAARAGALDALSGGAGRVGCAPAARRWTLVALAPFAPNEGERDRLLAAAAGLPRVRLQRALRPLAVLDGLALRALGREAAIFGDRLSPFAAIRLGIFGR